MTNKNELNTYDKPVGIIGEHNKGKSVVEYGYDGKTYYLAFGFFGTLAFGRMQMTLEQAKQAFNAIKFHDIEVDIDKWGFKEAKQALKEARKNKLTGDKLMFHFGRVFKKF